MTCEVELEDTELQKFEKQTYDMSFINGQIKLLRIVHWLCATCLLLANHFENRRLSNHYSQILNLISLCLYIVVIFSNIQSIFDLQWAIMSGTCEDFNDENIKQWILIEILAFSVNNFVVFCRIIVGRFCFKIVREQSLNHSLRQSKRIWNILKDEHALNDVEEDLRDE